LGASRRAAKGGRNPTLEKGGGNRLGHLEGIAFETEGEVFRGKKKRKEKRDFNREGSLGLARTLLKGKTGGSVKGEESKVNHSNKGEDQSEKAGGLRVGGDERKSRGGVGSVPGGNARGEHEIKGNIEPVEGSGGKRGSTLRKGVSFRKKVS